jgi:hypothetical protein
MKSKQQKRLEALARMELRQSKLSVNNPEYHAIGSRIAGLKRVIEGRPTELQAEKKTPRPGNPEGMPSRGIWEGELDRWQY